MNTLIDRKVTPKQVPVLHQRNATKVQNAEQLDEISFPSSRTLENLCLSNFRSITMIRIHDISLLTHRKTEIIQLKTITQITAKQ
jgi:hypothetical protein